MAAGDGLISMKPTSIAHAGTSASINADGGVDFSAVTSLSLNGVFTSDYDNYRLVFSGTHTSSGSGFRLRWRVSGSDASAANYVLQQLEAGATSVSGARSASPATFFTWGLPGSSLHNGSEGHAYGPALAQPTAWRSFDASSYDNAYMWNVAATHSLSTAYDGFTIYVAAGTLTGNIHVFGYEE